MINPADWHLRAASVLLIITASATTLFFCWSLITLSFDNSEDEVAVFKLAGVVLFFAAQMVVIFQLPISKKAKLGAETAVLQIVAALPMAIALAYYVVTTLVANDGLRTASDPSGLSRLLYGIHFIEIVAVCLYFLLVLVSTLQVLKAVSEVLKEQDMILE